MRPHLLPVIFFLSCLFASCDELPEPYNPPRLVNDFAEILTCEQADSLERVLVDFDNRTTNQICVVSVKTLGSRTVDDFGLALANKWGIGTEERQNGVLLLIKPRGRDNNYIDVTIQVGRGLEGAIPDVYASRIIRNVMGPYLKCYQYWPAIAKACDNLMGLASGEQDKPQSERSLKLAIQSVKQKIMKGIKDILLLLGFGLIAALVIWIISLFHKDDDDKDDKKKPKKRKKEAAFIPPPVDPFPLDTGNHKGDSGGFGGFGGGSFGGGGASGRF